MYKDSFTLIELLTVVAIMGILIIAGYPTYKSNLRQSRRQEGIQELLSLQIDVEKYIAHNKTLPNPAVAPYTTHNTTHDFYSITYTQVDITALTYTIVATAKGDQTNDVSSGTSCATLTLDSTADGITPVTCK